MAYRFRLKNKLIFLLLISLSFNTTFLFAQRRPDYNRAFDRTNFFDTKRFLSTLYGEDFVGKIQIPSISDSKFSDLKKNPKTISFQMKRLSDTVTSSEARETFNIIMILDEDGNYKSYTIRRNRDPEGVVYDFLYKDCQDSILLTSIEYINKIFESSKSKSPNPYCRQNLILRYKSNNRLISEYYYENISSKYKGDSEPIKIINYKYDSDNNVKNIEFLRNSNASFNMELKYNLQNQISEIKVHENNSIILEKREYDSISNLIKREIKMYKPDGSLDSKKNSMSKFIYDKHNNIKNANLGDIDYKFNNEYYQNGNLKSTRIFIPYKNKMEPSGKCNYLEYDINNNWIKAFVCCYEGNFLITRKIEYY